MGKNESASVNRRMEIISAAIEVYAETGYYRATTMQVAKRAGISQPYIFHFFSTKEELLLAALEASWQRIADSFRQVIATASPNRPDSEERTKLFIAKGMLCNISMALELPELMEG